MRVAGLRNVKIIKLLILVLLLCSAIVLPNCGGGKLPSTISADNGAGAGRQGPWYEECIRRQAITISSAMADSDQLDFPVLIRITDQSNPMFDRTQPDGDDLYFTENDGTTRLDHEIEYFMNTGTKELVAWVRIPLLSSTVDTMIYMHYGDSDISSQENPAGTWNSDYIMVQHLHETAGTHFDSTLNGNDGTSMNGVTQNAAGQIDGADDFDGSDDRINMGDVLNVGTNDFTFSAWIKTDAATSGRLVSKDDGSVGYKVWMIGSNGNIWLQFNDGVSGGFSSGSIVVNDGNWHHVVGVFDRDAIGEVYIDGIYDTGSDDISTATGSLSNGVDFAIGSNQGIGNFFNGSIDEVRISNVARSADWIEASWNNMNNPAGFLIIGAEEIINCLGTWLFRQQITISAAMAPSDQADFPVLIKISDQNNQLFNKARQSGADILFTMSNGMTKLAHELEYYRNTTTKELDAWVRIPVLSSASDTIIYMYYGNPVSGNQETVDLVWGDADYSGIWHLSESTGNHADTIGNVIGIRNGNTAVAGQIGNAQLFNGSSDYVNLGNSSHIYQYDDEFAVSAWIKRASTGTTQIVASRDNGDKGWRIMFRPTDQLRFLMIADCCPTGVTSWFIWADTNDTITDTDWHHIAAYYPGDTLPDNIVIYIDGVQVPVTPVVGSIIDHDYTYAAEPDAFFGRNNGVGGNYFDGSIDELRIMTDTPLLSDWMSANFNNQNNPTGFLTIGGEEAM